MDSTSFTRSHIATTKQTKSGKMTTKPATLHPLWLVLVWVEALRPSQQFFSHVGTEPPLAGYYQYFFGR